MVQAKLAASSISARIEPSTNSFFGTQPRITQLGTNKRGAQLARLIVSPVRCAPQRMNEVLHHDLPAVASHREREAGDRCQTVDRLVGDPLHLELCDQPWHDRHPRLASHHPEPRRYLRPS